MQLEQIRWMNGQGWTPAAPGTLGTKAQLILLFGSPACLKQLAWQADLAGQVSPSEAGLSIPGKVQSAG